MDMITNGALAQMYWKVVIQYCSSLEKGRYYRRKKKIADYSSNIVHQFEMDGNLSSILCLPDDVKFVLTLILEKGLEEARNIYPELLAERDLQFRRSDIKLHHSHKIVAVGNMTDRTRTPRKLPT